ncbi:MAG: malto-oligosyltrehalose synthase [Polyangiaceae bacterium]
MRAHRIPTATYRLQLGSDLDFAGALALVDYLDLLGVSDLYLSPVLAARPDSTHGYDVVDHSRVSPTLGTLDDLRALGQRLRERGMGMIVDIVPNHMCVADPQNRWWADVLENGPSSPYSRFFDIDWAPPKSDLAAKVLLPVLGDQYGRVLESGDMRVVYAGGAFSVHLHGMELPIAPRTWTHVLEPVADALRARLGEEDPAAGELLSVLVAIGHLPPRGETDPVRVRERQREKEIVKRRLAALVEGSPAAEEAIAAQLAKLNGQKGDPRSFDALEALLADQAYRLSFWRVACDEINYRRFFDINELAAIRVEEPRVFAAVHEVALALIGEGIVTGLRIDHVDGLASPERYLQELARACHAALSGGEPPAGAEASRPPVHVTVEKILLGAEKLPDTWPIAGTTGYDFLNALNGLFVDPRGALSLLRGYEADIGHRSFADVAYQCKKLILKVSLSSELTMLARRLDRVSEQHRYSRDFTLNSLQEALAELLACFPVYRTYIRDEDTAGTIGGADRGHLALAVREAKRRNPAVSESIFDFIAAVLLAAEPDGIGEADLAERREFTNRFQQLTAPVMAKGVEDTAFYRHTPLASVNEVGGDPERPSITVTDFHRMNALRLKEWPHTQNATSTHDTKRSEDVRARINVLSELPSEWLSAVTRWRGMNARLRADVDGAPAPGPTDEHLFYQTLAGAWPSETMTADSRARFTERMTRYMEKAAREAKVRTSWIRPNEPFDRALATFVSRALDPAESADFLQDFASFHAKIERPGLFASVSQALLKIVSPGVPDFYQGTELHKLSLVDPDNRGPVDFDRRRALLGEIRRDAERDMPSFLRSAVLGLPDGRLKLHVVHRALLFRKRRRDLFEWGDYVPVAPEGDLAHHAVAFARVSGDAALIAIAGRFFASLAPPDRAPTGSAWRDTRLLLEGKLAGATYCDVLTGETIETGKDPLRLDAVLRHLPVALLERLS